MFIVYIESSFQHWVSFSFHHIPYTHTQYILLLNHWVTSSTYFFISSFIFQTFLLTTIYKKQKQKPLLLLISPHLRLHFLQPFHSLCLFTSPTTLYFTVTLPSSFFIVWLFFFPFYLYTFMVTLSPTFLFPLYLFTSPTTFYFTITLPSLFSFLFFITWLLFFPFYLYKFNIISPIQSIIFSTQKPWVLSLSLSLGEFLFFFIILIKIDGFYKKICVSGFFFNFYNFSLQSLLSPFYIDLVEFWFRLVLSFFFFFFGNRNLSLYQNTINMVMNLNIPTNYLNNNLW